MFVYQNVHREKNKEKNCSFYTVLLLNVLDKLAQSYYAKKR